MYTKQLLPEDPIIRGTVQKYKSGVRLSENLSKDKREAKINPPCSIFLGENYV
jgi:hypothetical protein